MIQPTTTRRPAMLGKGDVITVNPGTGEPVEWTVAALPGSGCRSHVHIAYTNDLGRPGTVIVGADEQVQIRIAAREVFIAGLRDLADYLHSNPDVPLDDHVAVRVAYFPKNSGVTDLIAEVDRVAELLAEQPTARSHYRVGKAFGPVGYEAIVCDVAELLAEAALS